MPSIKAPASKQTATLSVVVKCRPLTSKELKRSRNIVRVTDTKEVVVLDPDLSKDYLDRVQNRTKEKKYHFDYAFGPDSTNLDVYRTSISSTIAGVIQGLNATVFAYGSTGRGLFRETNKAADLLSKLLPSHRFVEIVPSSFAEDLKNIIFDDKSGRIYDRIGKTYTMVGAQDDPGLMVLSLHTIFGLIKKDSSSDDFEVTCSYLEVYNEVIYDLLEKSSGHLELREDPEQGIVVAGLRCIKVHSADRILELLNVGNSRRKTESTEANATSSRSHAVLEITVKRKQKNQYRNQVVRGKLALVDLAGSERASETNSGGQKLRDGANINRSLLALANCINALGKQQKKGLAYVPYRNSKLTRILKDGLSGNSRTVMIATVSPADNQYHHTVNTLKYADRAKEIKTHIQKNIGTVDTHVADYQRMIDNLQIEVCRLRKELADKETQLSVKPSEKTVDDELSWLNVLSHETSENVQERINLQKALFELEETNLRNRIELQHLDGAISKQQAIEKDGPVVQALRSRRQLILDNIRDNDEADMNYQKEIRANEKHRWQLQDMIEEAISNNGNKTYLHILSQYRLLGMANTELQFEMAMRDQVIHNQREAQRNLWNLIMGLGLDQKQIMEIASKQGITIEDWVGTSHRVPPSLKQSPSPGCGRLPPFWSSPGMGQSYSSSSSVLQHQQSFGSRSCVKCECDSAHTVSREEHHSSYFLVSDDHSPSTYLGMRSSEHWVSSGRPGPGSCTPETYAQDVRHSFPEMRTQSSTSEACTPTTSVHEGIVQKKDAWNESRWQMHELPHVGLSTGHSPSCTETITHHAGPTRTLFGNSPLELSSGSPSSRHVFRSVNSSNHRNLSHLLPSYTAPVSIPCVSSPSDRSSNLINFV